MGAEDLGEGLGLCSLGTWPEDGVCGEGVRLVALRSSPQAQRGRGLTQGG